MSQKSLFRSGVVFIHIFAFGMLWGIASKDQDAAQAPQEIPNIRGTIHDLEDPPKSYGPQHQPSDGTYWT